MRIKFVRADSQKKYPKSIEGIELTNDRGMVSILGIDLSDCDDVDIFDINKSEYKITDSNKDRVEYLFKRATLEVQNDLNKAVIELLKTKRNVQFAESKLKQYFGKTIKDIKLEELS